MSKQSRGDFEACLAADSEIRRQIQEEEKAKKHWEKQIEDMRTRKKDDKK